MRYATLISSRERPLEERRVAIELRFEHVPNWERLPEGWTHRDVDGVTVDDQDLVYVITRYDPRVIVYEPDGAFVAAWGERLFSERTHGITFSPDGTLWCVDEGNHVVRKHTRDGQVLLTLGKDGVASDTGYDGRSGESITHGGQPFNRPTYAAVAPNGEVYVADGYGNARVHRFASDGTLVQSWGEPGVGPGQFNLPHGVAVAPDSRVFVADRENDRIQIFGPEGEYLTEWTHVRRPTAVRIVDGLAYVAELAWLAGQRSFRRGVLGADEPGRVSVLTLDGEVVTRFGDSGDPCAPGNLYAPHDVAVDSRGDVYVGEVTYSFSGRGRAGEVPAGCHTLQKFRRVG
jgi:DNA-binding beta-propeller fold protein YncE